MKGADAGSRRESGALRPAEAAKALVNGRHAELFDVLAQGERSVEELAAEIDQTVANISQDLRRMLRSGLVRSRRAGTDLLLTVQPSGRRPLAPCAGQRKTTSPGSSS